MYEAYTKSSLNAATPNYARFMIVTILSDYEHLGRRSFQFYTTLFEAIKY